MFNSISRFCFACCLLVAFGLVIHIRAQDGAPPPPSTASPEPRTRVGRWLDRLDRKAKLPSSATSSIVTPATSQTATSETSQAAPSAKRRVTTTTDRVTRTTKVNLTPQILYEDKAERVTLSAEYDSAQAKANARNVVDIPAEATLKFMFSESDKAPKHASRAEVIFVIDERAERARPAFFTHARIGSTLAPPTLTTGVSPSLLRKLARARRLQVQVAEREFSVNQNLLSALAEFADAIKEP